jgi:hypothetical protein
MIKKSIFLLLTSGLSAGVSLSPSDPLFPEEGLLFAKESFATFKAGYYLDYIWKTNLKNREGINHAKLSSLTQYGALSLCLSDLVDLYGLVGVQNNTLNFQNHQQPYCFKQHLVFSWSLLAQGILNQWGKWQLGTSAFYTSTPSQEGSLLTKGQLLQTTTYQSYAWGLSLGFSYDYPPFAPYGRIDYQNSKSKIDAFKTQHFQTLHPLGLAFGFVSDLGYGLFIDAECRIIQSWASRLMLGLRF